MSTRIDEIAMVANEQTDNKFDLNHRELDTFLKKFAELIIKECIDCMEPLGQTSRVEARDAIQDHFRS